MSEEKFTQGEWDILDCRENPGADYDYSIVDSDGWCIVHIVNCGLEEQEANAALIAAAPEMYRELNRQCLLCKLRDHETECEFCNIDGILKKARGSVCDSKEEAIEAWNTRPAEDALKAEIERLKVELDNLRHFCDSILDMVKRNNGVLYFKQDSGTWEIETGKATNVSMMEEK